MDLTLLSTKIRTRDGMFLLNDLHHAGGAADGDKPNRFTRNKKTRELLDEITQAPDMALPLKVVRSEGIYACKEVVYAYAMWISPKFNLAVIRAFDKLATQSVMNIPRTLPEALQLAADQALEIEKKDKILQEQEVYIEKMSPIVESAVMLTESTGNMSLTLASKHFSIGRKEMVAMMEDNRWLYRAKNKSLVGFEPKLRVGYLEHKIHVVERDKNKKAKVYSQVLVTPKGLLALGKMVAQLEWRKKATVAIESMLPMQELEMIINEAPKGAMRLSIYSELVAVTLPKL